MEKMTYVQAAHAMQSGVAMKMNVDVSETTPKHLRVGVNSAMVETSALAKLLVAKGVFTKEEFEAVLTEEMTAEAERYEKWCREKFGPGVTLA